MNYDVLHRLNLITAVLLPLGGAAVDGWNFYQISQPQRINISPRDLAVAPVLVFVLQAGALNTN